MTEQEVEKLIATARRRGRYGQRDATAILICYRHGLRVSEPCGMTWDRIDFASADIVIRRAKNGKTTTHPLNLGRARALR